MISRAPAGYMPKCTPYDLQTSEYQNKSDCSSAAFASCMCEVWMWWVANSRGGQNVPKPAYQTRYTGAINKMPHIAGLRYPRGLELLYFMRTAHVPCMCIYTSIRYPVDTRYDLYNILFRYSMYDGYVGPYRPLDRLPMGIFYLFTRTFFFCFPTPQPKNSTTTINTINSSSAMYVQYNVQGLSLPHTM